MQLAHETDEAKRLIVEEVGETETAAASGGLSVGITVSKGMGSMTKGMGKGIGKGIGKGMDLVKGMGLGIGGLGVNASSAPAVQYYTFSIQATTDSPGSDAREEREDGEHQHLLRVTAVDALVKWLNVLADAAKMDYDPMCGRWTRDARDRCVW